MYVTYNLCMLLMCLSYVCVLLMYSPRSQLVYEENFNENIINKESHR